MRYPQIAALMGGWFHQDFDLVGETVAEIAADFARSASARDIAALVVEIDQFCAEHGDNLDAAFESCFAPQVIVAAFSGSTAAFLADLRAQLAP